MKLKSSIYVLLFLLIALPTQAQNNDKKNKNKEAVVQENKNNKGKKESDTYKKDKDRNDDEVFYKNDDNNYKKNKAKSNNGNAYGNNKNGLEGREFGQERARQARLQNQQRKQKFNESIVIYDRRYLTLRERLQSSLVLLDQQRPSLTPEVYEVRRVRLEVAQQKMTVLEKSLLIARTLLN